MGGAIERVPPNEFSQFHNRYARPHQAHTQSTLSLSLSLSLAVMQSSVTTTITSSEN